VVRVGDELPEFSRRTDLDNWNRFAAVNDEFVPIHMDDGAGQEAGYPGAFGMGNLQWAYMHNAVRDWLGPHGEIKSMSCQFRAPNLRGTTVTVRGVVTEVVPDDRGVQASIDLRTTTDDGHTLAPGTAVVVLHAAIG
jgi:acyl dehydratase